MTPLPRALLPDTASRAADGHLHIGGCDTLDLAAQYDTPLYVYDQNTLLDNARAYQTALEAHYPAGATVSYAAKAYLCTALAQFWDRAGLGLDVVGPGELATALQAHLPPERIHLHGNNKPPALLARAIEVDVGRIVIDGWHDFERIDKLAPAKPIRVWLRLSPGIDVHTHDYRKTGLLDAKFGFPIATGDAAQAVQRALDTPHIKLVGLHAHIGSQIFETEPFRACIETLVDFAARMRDRHGWAPAEISPGGGAGVPYTAQQPPAPVSLYIKSLCEATIRRCAEKNLPLPRLVLEPGRSLVARAGVALYTVGGKKAIPNGRTFIFIDGGLADNPRPALYGAQYTALCANRPAQRRETVTLCGPFCESGDILTRDVSLPPLSPGDIVAIPMSGAYQLSMASAYNGFPRPAAVWVQNGHAEIIQRRETVHDLLSRDRGNRSI